MEGRVTEDERALLMAAITETARAPEDAMERLGHRRIFTIMSAAMFEAMERGLSQEMTQEQVRAYVEDLFERLPKLHGEIEPAALEAVIRGGLGEEELLEPLSYNDILVASYTLTYDLIAGLKLDDAAREKYFRAVIALADEES